MATDAQFHDSIEVNLELDCPFKASRPKRLNEFGIPVKRQYRSEEVATALGISTDLLRWRFRKGKYPEVRKDSAGRRIFSLADIKCRGRKWSANSDVQHQFAEPRRVEKVADSYRSMHGIAEVPKFSSYPYFVPLRQSLNVSTALLVRVRPQILREGSSIWLIQKDVQEAADAIHEVGLRRRLP